MLGTVALSNNAPMEATMQETIAIVATGCAILSFLVYLAFSIKALTSKAATKVEESLKAAAASIRELTPPTAKELAEVLKALASLAESLVKAGPALWSMLGSALFLLIAALAIGVFSGSPDGGSGPAEEKEATESENAVDTKADPASNNSA